LSQISVAIGPGYTTCTRTPVASRSAASTSLHPVIANFDAVYAASRGLPTRPATDATFTTCPARRSIIDGSAASVAYTAPMKLTCIARSTFSGVRRAAWMRMGIPALFTSTSSLPCRAIVPRTSASHDVRSATSVTTASHFASAATAASKSARRAAATTTAPRAERSSAIARPIPLDAPVATTTLPRQS
jgi:hypothetical protein